MKITVLYGDDYNDDDKSDLKLAYKRLISRNEPEPVLTLVLT